MLTKACLVSRSRSPCLSSKMVILNTPWNCRRRVAGVLLTLSSRQPKYRPEIWTHSRSRTNPRLSNVLWSPPQRIHLRAAGMDTGGSHLLVLGESNRVRTCQSLSQDGVGLISIYFEQILGRTEDTFYKGSTYQRQTGRLSSARINSRHQCLHATSSAHTLKVRWKS